MTMPLHEIEAEALQLPPQERGQLVERLLSSLEQNLEGAPHELSKAWEEEIARRIEDMESGRTKSVPYEQVRAELRAMIDAARRG